MSDDKYMADQTPLAMAMLRAQEAEAEANKARAEALRAADHERLAQEDIARRTALSVSRNEQLLAAQAGIGQRQVFSSQSVGMVATPEMVAATPIMWGGVQLGPAQAKQMMETGQITRADYQRGLTEALAAQGYAVPFI